MFVLLGAQLEPIFPTLFGTSQKQQQWTDSRLKKGRKEGRDRASADISEKQSVAAELFM